MEIKQNLISEEKWGIKCPHSMTPIGICVHNTANDASARNENAYEVSNNSSTSFHLAVDDNEVWQAVPFDRNSWHAGDGANGVGNRKYIAIEICYSKSGGERFDKAESRAAELIAQLLKERGWGTDRVKKHQDFSGKYCPHRTLDLGWDRFINQIKKRMEEPMAADLHIYLGVNNDTEAKARLKEHLGEVNGKCNWGSEGDQGGFLGSERKLTKTLLSNHSGIAVLLGLPADATNDQILDAINRLKHQANQPPSNPSSPIIGVLEEIELNGRTWILNGLNIVHKGSEKEYHANYMRKG